MYNVVMYFDNELVTSWCVAEKVILAISGSFLSYRV